MYQLIFSLILIINQSRLGIGNPVDANRVVNGTDTKIDQFPFMASMQNKIGAHLCGGTIIHQKYVLTAAHCCHGRIATAVQVSYNSTRLNDLINKIVVPVLRIISHPAFDYYGTINDIALLEVQTPMIVRQYAALPKPFMDTMPNTEATLLGWGYEKTNGDIQKNLQAATILIYSDSECRAIHHKTIYPSNICAGVPGGGIGQCSGDSGGPLIVYGTQVGIVSWSEKPCAIAPYPGVFTQISYYIQWIEHIIESN